MRLEDFIEMVERERPETLEAADVRKVQPNPWVLRAGHGSEARIRMPVGRLRYERAQGESVWHRSDVASDFDVEDAA